MEGSHAVARQTAELLRSVVSQHRMGSSANQAATLADAVRAVGEQLIAANPIGKCFSIFFHCGFMLSCWSLFIVCFLKHTSLIKPSKANGIANSLYCSDILLALHNVNVYAIYLICNFAVTFLLI